MKVRVLMISMILVCLTSCEYKKELITGLTIKGNGLNCKDVYLTVADEKIYRNTFIYGEKFNINFDNINDFTKEGNSVFPGLELLITNQKGDTAIYNKDLYAKVVNGFDISPLLLKTSITVANPIMSSNKYRMYVNIWDKKGGGTYKAEMNFDVVPNKKIKVNSNAVSYNEIYLFSNKNNITITNNKAKLNENIYLLFEGLEGFKIENGKVLIGISMTAKDSKGKLLLDEKDLANNTGMEVSELNNRVAPFFIFSNENFTNPITCEVKIWDKRGKNKIDVTVDIDVN